MSYLIAERILRAFPNSRELRSEICPTEDSAVQLLSHQIHEKVVLESDRPPIDKNIFTMLTNRVRALAQTGLRLD